MSLSDKQKMLIAALAVLISVLAVAVVILAAVPPVSRDALVHHLAVPKLWISHGSIYEMPDKVYSYYPMTLDLLYTVPLYLGNDIVPKYIHFAFALATSWLMFNFVKHRLGVVYALLAALLFLSTPVVVKLSITAYVDLGLVFFSTAALMYTLKWQREIPRMRYLYLAALMGGLALGTKYNGLIIMLLMMFFVFMVVSRGIGQGRITPLQAVLCIVVFGGVAGLTYAPWGIKNLLWTGNPLYPLFDQWFNPSDPYAATTIPPIVLRKLLYGETWWEILLVPLRIFFQGMDDSPRYFDGQLNPALLVLPVFAFISTGDSREEGQGKLEKNVMLFFSIMFILFVFFKTSMRIRYIAPVVPCLVILSIFGLKSIFSFVGRYCYEGKQYIAGSLSLAILLLLFYGNTAYVIEQFSVVRPFQYLNGSMSRDQYIEAFRPEYALIKHANAALPPDAKILALFIGKRGYYSDRQMIFDTGLLASVLHQSHTLEAMRTGFVNLGITHMLIRFDLFDDWRNNNLDDEENELLQAFFSRERVRLLEKNGHGLYQLGDPR